MKRHRKQSLQGAVSEPKNLKLDISDAPATQLDGPLSIKSKMNVETNGVVPEPSKPDAIQTPSKKKKRKKASAKVENNVSAQSENKNGKKIKRNSDVLQEGSAVPMHIKKKKKKEKELMGEMQNFKVELGIVGALIPENPVETEKSHQKTPIADANMAEDKYPILKDKELVEKFLKVPMNNSQKGRIRQALKMSLQGISATLFPDIINGKIQAILSTSTNLTDPELRRIRILYNMLRTALATPDTLQVDPNTLKKKKKKKKEKKNGEEKKEDEDGEDKKEDGEEKTEDGEEKKVKKVKGPKRYVVFLGNLPLDVNKEMIMEHFRELNEHIVDIRVPPRPAEHKSAIAYIELSNEPSYEMALSKHHSMLGNKRIKVLYTTQQNGKVSKAEAKGKSAKLIALQKAGKLVGSVPAAKKRSHRRAIMKQAKAKEAAATSTE